MLLSNPILTCRESIILAFIHIYMQQENKSIVSWHNGTRAGQERWFFSSSLFVVRARTIFRNHGGDRLRAGVINRQPTLEDVRQTKYWVTRNSFFFFLRLPVALLVKVCGFHFIFVACWALRNWIWFFVHSWLDGWRSNVLEHDVPRCFVLSFDGLGWGDQVLFVEKCSVTVFPYTRPRDWN